MWWYHYIPAGMMVARYSGIVKITTETLINRIGEKLIKLKKNFVCIFDNITHSRTKGTAGVIQARTIIRCFGAIRSVVLKQF